MPHYQADQISESLDKLHKNRYPGGLVIHALGKLGSLQQVVILPARDRKRHRRQFHINTERRSAIDVVTFTESGHEISRQLAMASLALNTERRGRQNLHMATTGAVGKKLASVLRSADTGSIKHLLLGDDGVSGILTEGIISPAHVGQRRHVQPGQTSGFTVREQSSLYRHNHTLPPVAVTKRRTPAYVATQRRVVAGIETHMDPSVIEPGVGLAVSSHHGLNRRNFDQTYLVPAGEYLEDTLYGLCAALDNRRQYILAGKEIVDSQVTGLMVMNSIDGASA